MSPMRTPAPAEIEELRLRLHPLAMRRRLGRDQWAAPTPYGEGWLFDSTDRLRRIIVTYWPKDIDTEEPWEVDWVHASISRRGGQMPIYEDLKVMHHGVFGDGHAYQLFVPAAEHIDIGTPLGVQVLHLWGRADGKPALPDFGKFGTI